MKGNTTGCLKTRMIMKLKVPWQHIVETLLNQLESVKICTFFWVKIAKICKFRGKNLKK